MRYCCFCLRSPGYEDDSRLLSLGDDDLPESTEYDRASGAANCDCTAEALGVEDEALGVEDEALGVEDEALGVEDEALGVEDEAMSSHRPPDCSSHHSEGDELSEPDNIDLPGAETLPLATGKRAPPPLSAENRVLRQFICALSLVEPDLVMKVWNYMIPAVRTRLVQTYMRVVEGKTRESTSKGIDAYQYHRRQNMLLSLPLPNWTPIRPVPESNLLWTVRGGLGPAWALLPKRERMKYILECERHKALSIKW